MKLKKGDLVYLRALSVPDPLRAGIRMSQDYPDVENGLGVVTDIQNVLNSKAALVYWQTQMKRYRPARYFAIRLLKVERDQDNKETFRRINENGIIEEG